MKSILLLLSMVFYFATARAQGPLDGIWYSEDGKRVRVVQDFQSLRISTRSYYSNGASSDYYFHFNLAHSTDLVRGHTYQGSLESVDSYFGCVFHQPATLTLEWDDRLRVDFVLLGFHKSKNQCIVDQVYPRSNRLSR